MLFLRITRLRKFQMIFFSLIKLVMYDSHTCLVRIGWGHLVSVFLLVLVLAQMSCYLICYAMIYCIRFFRWLFMLFYRKYVNWIFDYKAVCIIDNKYNNK